MSWIRTVTEGEAEGELADVYRDVASRRGKLSNIMRIQSLAPRAMKAHLDLYMEVMFERGGLSRAERELLAVVVSVENGCEYCTLHHRAALAAWWKDSERVAELVRDPASAMLGERERALADHALGLTRDPTGPGPEGVRRLRDAGLSDREILQVTMIVAYFNFVNRIAEGLGVQAPPDEVEGYRY